MAIFTLTAIATTVVGGILKEAADYFDGKDSAFGKKTPKSKDKDKK